MSTVSPSSRKDIYLFVSWELLCQILQAYKYGLPLFAQTPLDQWTTKLRFKTRLGISEFYVL